MFPYRPTALISVREQREECCGTGPASSPEANLVFVNSIDWCSTVKLDTKAPVFEAGKPFLGSANAFGDKDKRKRAWLTAVNASTEVDRWGGESCGALDAGSGDGDAGLVFTAGL